MDGTRTWNDSPLATQDTTPRVRLPMNHAGFVDDEAEHVASYLRTSGYELPARAHSGRGKSHPHR